MQSEPIETLNRSESFTSSTTSFSSIQHGSSHYDIHDLHRAPSERSSSFLSESGRSESISSDDARLESRGGSLSWQFVNGVPFTPGQRISEYENAMIQQTPKRALGFKIVKSAHSDNSSGVNILDFPNEILAHVISYLHIDSHRAVALVSKRFYTLTTTQHIWRLAFFRYFPGHHALESGFKNDDDQLSMAPSSDLVRSDVRYFSRLTNLATWRSEYLFRTTLLSSLARGKPHKSNTGSSANRSSKADKKSSAVLTYNARLPWAATSIDAIFDNGNKAPRAIHGSSLFGVATMSDPTVGKVSKWGFEDPHVGLLDLETDLSLNMYGLGPGPTATDDVMDVSQIYGLLAGEGFPGGRVLHRSTGDAARRCLSLTAGLREPRPNIPTVPVVFEGISSVWIAKSSALPTITESTIGMLTGSTMGVVRAYSLAPDPKLPRGTMTAQWILSPGVPIISLKVDDNYSLKRKSANRVWIVALNALGEVFYLTDIVVPLPSTSLTGNVTLDAWTCASTVHWQLLDQTSRQAQTDDIGVSSAEAVRDVAAALDLYSTREKTVSEQLDDVKLMDKLIRLGPSHFRHICKGWDMRRRLEVDFSSDDGAGAGECIFVLNCGHAGEPGITRFQRSLTTATSSSEVDDNARPTPNQPGSLFGNITEPTEQQSGDAIATIQSKPLPKFSKWHLKGLDLKKYGSSIISASALDNSIPSLLTVAEDPLLNVEDPSATKDEQSDEEVQVDIPGKRARYFVIGNESGAVLIWNSRASQNADNIEPIRMIQTTSPKVKCVAASSLYVVHGGSDGLVQAWDPLASTTDVVRTLNTRSNGQLQRRLRNLPNPEIALNSENMVGAIFMDPNPSNLRGIVSLGWHVKYWSYSSKSPGRRRKRRNRHIDAHGRLASRRQAGDVSDFIAEEEKELVRGNQERARELVRLKARFGVGAFGDLTDHEALEYAQILSSEAFLADEQRRASDSAEDTSVYSASSSMSDITPEPSIIEQRSPMSYLTTDEEDDYEEQLQQALRLSLIEGVNDMGQSPRGNSPDDFDFLVKYKTKGGKRSKGVRSTPQSPSSRVASMSSVAGPAIPPQDTTTMDQDLALAISLSMQDQVDAPFSERQTNSEEFPALDGDISGKGKGHIRRR